VSAELLRRAAQFLRTRAEAAAPGPWTAVDPNEGSGAPPLWSVVNDAFLNPSDDNTAALDLELHAGEQPDAYYVELMHPPVALALAAWLEAHADLWDRWPTTLAGTGNDPSPAALALAQAILREQP
jgi:hypothetical protein